MRYPTREEVLIPLFLVLGMAFLLVFACSGERPAMRDSADTPMMAAAMPRPRQDTTRWQDTTRKGDTVFFNSGLVITSKVVTTDPPTWKLYGIPLSVSSAWTGTRLPKGVEHFTATYNGETPQTIVARIVVARAMKKRLWVALAGGAKSQYHSRLPDFTTPDPNDSVTQFDVAKWRARMDQYDAPTIRPVILAAIEDGMLAGNTVIDEPFNTGQGPGQEHNGVGPKGTLTKARVDSMCAYAKAKFPGLPQAAAHDWDDFEPNKAYRVCDLFVNQYRYGKGSMREFRARGLALAQRDSHQVAVGLNVMDGGTPASRKRPDGTRKTDYEPGDCPVPETGGRGTYFPNCRMTPAQIIAGVDTIAPGSCFVNFWRYDATMATDTGYQQAVRAVAAALKDKPRIPCRRRS